MPGAHSSRQVGHYVEVSFKPGLQKWIPHMGMDASGASAYLKANFFLCRSILLALSEMHCISSRLQYRTSAIALSSSGSTHEQSRGPCARSHG